MQVKFYAKAFQWKGEVGSRPIVNCKASASNGEKVLLKAADVPYMSNSPNLNSASMPGGNNSPAEDSCC